MSLSEFKVMQSDRDLYFYAQHFLSFLVLVAASDVTQRSNLTTLPDSISEHEGATITMICKVDFKISACRFNLPGIIDEIKLNPSWSQTEQKNENFSYVGTGLANGECGIRVANVNKSLNGQAKCFLDPNDGKLDSIGTINITISDRPANPTESTVDKSKLQVNYGDQAKKIVSDVEVETTSNAEVFEASTNASTTEELVVVTNPSTTVELVSANSSTPQEFVAVTNPSTYEESNNVETSTLSSNTIKTLVTNQTQQLADEELVTESGNKSLITKSIEEDNSTDDGK